MATEKAPVSSSAASYVTTLISTPGQNTPIEIDSDFEFEVIPSPTFSSSSADSSLGASISSTTTSLKSIVQAYPFENGRRYHAYHAGSYLVPNDRQEQDRMDLSHHVWKLVLGERLVSEAVSEGLSLESGGMRRVLDLGTGTGIWAIDFADEWVERGVVVVGNDLSPIQPRWVPPNCTFIVDDFEPLWTYHQSEAFDFIHARSLAGSVASWPSLVSSMHTHLQPGGWVELQECEVKVFSDEDIALDKAPAVRDWVKLLELGGALFGKRFDIVEELEVFLKAGGFVDVGRDVYEVPIGYWSFDDSEIGLLQRASVVEMVEPFTTALLYRVLKWTLKDTNALIERVQKELRDVNLRLYCRFHSVYGRKAKGNEAGIFESWSGGKGVAYPGGPV